MDRHFATFTFFSERRCVFGQKLDLGLTKFTSFEMKIDPVSCCFSQILFAVGEQSLRRGAGQVFTKNRYIRDSHFLPQIPHICMRIPSKPLKRRTQEAERLWGKSGTRFF